MNHYYVLGYTKNLVVNKYFDLYFQQLLAIFQELDLGNDYQDSFSKLSQQQQYDFLCASDISCLLQEIKMHGKEKTITKLGEECRHFFTGSKDKCTFSLGKTIPGTKIKLTVHDNNYKNNVSTHPDHDSGNMIGWGIKSEKQWMEVFASSLALLKKVNREFYDELNSIIQKIVPFGTSLGVHNSCSYKETIGVLYLGFTTDVSIPELSILEALIHESSHNKLNIIMHSEKLTLNDSTLRYYSPYRPDARHIYGVLLGVHAIVPTVYTMLQAIAEGHITDTSWQSKVVLYHIKNKIGMRVLRKYAKCTKIGYEILDELDAVMKLSDSMIAKSVELQRLDIRDIQQQAKSHFLDVQKNYSRLEY